MDIDSAEITPKQCSILIRQAMQRGQPGRAYAITAVRGIARANAEKSDPLRKLRHYRDAWQAITEALKCEDNRPATANLKDQFSQQLQSAVPSIVRRVDREHREMLSACSTRGMQRRTAGKAVRDMTSLLDACKGLPVPQEIEKEINAIYGDWQDQLALLTANSAEQVSRPTLRKGPAAWEVVLPSGKVEGFRRFEDARRFAVEQGGTSEVESVAPEASSITVVHPAGDSGIPIRKPPKRLPIDTDHLIVV